jgi:hypothetical protein
MPRQTRSMLQQAARVIRAEGETVTLLLDTSPADASDVTPYSGVDLQTPPKLSTFTQIPVYARVSYHKTELLTFDQGGREKNKRATIEFAFEYQSLVKQATFVMLQDGTVMRKSAENLSEGRDLVIIETEGAWGLSQ